jgi:hypothetical protein
VEENCGTDTIWVTSVRDPDGATVCEISWGGQEWYPSVAAIRMTALDLVTCAAYAEMMMKLIGLGLPKEHVLKFTADMLSGTDRTMFGTPETVELHPAGSTKRREPLVVVKRGTLEGSFSPEVARGMALQWLEVAEAAESDQLVAEALRVNGADEAYMEKVFGYLRSLRTSETGHG